MGEELVEVSETTQSREWFTNEGFWSAFKPFAFGPLRWNRAACDVNDLLGLLRPASDRPELLDLCCGPGRYALELARRGARVTAVDRSATYLAELGDHLARESLSGSLEIVQADMRAFLRPRAFDGAICVGLSFGYCASREEDVAVLSNVRTSLRTGASFILDVPTTIWPDELGPWYVVRSPEQKSAFIEQEVASDRSRVISRWRFDRDGEIVDYGFSQRLFSAAELLSDLARAGFQNVELYDNYGGAPLQEGSRKIVAVCRTG